MKPLKLSENDFARLFNTRKDSFPKQCRDIIKKRDFRYCKIDNSEKEKITSSILKRIDSNTLSIAGPHRQPQWESGWSENFKDYIKTRDNYSLTPKFIKPGQPIRLNRDFVVPLSNRFEFDFVDVLRRWLFLKYFKDKSSIYEFGCGSCQHLVVLCELFPRKSIFGLDWAASSLKIIDKLSEFNKCDLNGKLFDLLNPDYAFKLPKDSAVFTVGTLEQLGSNFEAFLKYLLRDTQKDLREEVLTEGIEGRVDV